VGTTDGQVFMYEIEEIQSRSGEVRWNTRQQLQTTFGRGRKNVEQMEVIGQLGQLIAICDGTLWVLKMNTLETINQFSLPKGAPVQAFCSGVLSKRAGIKGLSDYHLCVLSKRKLLVMKILSINTVIKEYTLAETPTNLLWHAGRIYMGHRKHYMALNVESGDLITVHQTRGSDPHMAVLNDEVLLCDGHQGMLYNLTLSEPKPIEFSQSVHGIVFRHPYLVTLQKNQLEVHNVLDRSLIQTIPSSASYHLTGQGSRMILASSSHVYGLVAVPLKQQVNELLNKQFVNEAIQLFEAAGKDREDFDELKTDIYQDAAWALFSHLDFRRAFEFFRRSDADPRTVLARFPGLLPSDCEVRQAEITVSMLVTKRLQKGRPDNAEIQAKIKTKIQEALATLVRYLEEIRDPQDPNRAKQEAIDTALLYLYVDLGLSRKHINNFASNENRIHLKDAQTYLTRRKMWYTIALLCCYRRKYNLALELYRKLGTNELQDGTYVGLQETINILKTLDDCEVLWEYSKWTLRKDLERGMKIFCSTDRRIPLAAGKVLEFLSEFGSTPRQIYLEFLINERDNKDEQYHTKLALLYLDTTQALVKLKMQGSQEAEDGSLGRVRRKLLDFLTSSKHYNVATVLARVRGTVLYEECIVLYRNLGDHQLAVSILVEKIGAYERAEKYCAAIEDAEVRDEMFLFLLQLLLRLPIKKSDVSGLSQPVLHLLRTYARYLHPIRVLGLLPKELPLSYVHSYLRMAMQESQHSLHEAQVKSSLMKTQHIRVKSDLMTLRNRSVTVTSNSRCAVCGKHIGDRVFAAYPTGTLVHFKCLKETDNEVDPSTGRDFSKYPFDVSET